MTVTSVHVEAYQLRIIRRKDTPAAVAQADQINLGLSSISALVASLVAQAAACTAPAILMCNYIEGKVPDTARVDSLAAFCQSQYDSYAALGVADPLLGPYEALGSAFGTTPEFGALVAGRTLDQIITAAYQHAFLITPSPAQVAHFASQHAYFYALYTGASMPDGESDLKAKGAMVGQIIGHSGKTYSANLHNKATAWLNAAAYDFAPYGVALV